METGCTTPIRWAKEEALPNLIASLTVRMGLLDVQSVCQCALVSRAWRSVAYSRSSLSHALDLQNRKNLSKDQLHTLILTRFKMRGSGAIEHADFRKTYIDIEEFVKKSERLQVLRMSPLWRDNERITTIARHVSYMLHSVHYEENDEVPDKYVAAQARVWRHVSAEELTNILREYGDMDDGEEFETHSMTRVTRFIHRWAKRPVRHQAIMQVTLCEDFRAMLHAEAYDPDEYYAGWMNIRLGKWKTFDLHFIILSKQTS
eukprot:878113_1